MILAVFWKLRPDLSPAVERELVGEMLSTLPNAAMEVKFTLWLGPSEGVSVVEADEATPMWKALDPYIDRVDLSIKPAVYFPDHFEFLRRRQELLADAEDWFEQLPRELREASPARGRANPPV